MVELKDKKNVDPITGKADPPDFIREGLTRQEELEKRFGKGVRLSEQTAEKKGEEND